MVSLKYAKDLLRQMEEMKKDKAETDQALENTTHRLRKYEVSISRPSLNTSIDNSI